ncbi:hypothetical protein PFICI_10003 [Pestalotiopsis fici W106-1]|uniref:Uncharacterized protein n=1 Tax=Pestalotiopsis fici (strain W106-1 / CGMCC3.15140) TaxID=1229662 RepID=W3WYH8_PESFW|nr:uncharacterized protein PFICI_10003 [Pestalotiopsis fici W106-1]ETS77941.1 hypothetical protein PFICI_10003 [Pestalotiopsis fici W106-1]
MDLTGLPQAAPSRPENKLRYADVAVTPTAKEFAGIYRGKQYHEPDFTNTLDRAWDAGVEKVMLTGMSVTDVSSNLAIAKSRPPNSCFVTMGVHPYNAGEPGPAGSEYYDKLGQAIRDALAEPVPLIKAYGELGLDYDRLVHADKETQIATFKAQLDMVIKEKWDLPLFLHCRAAFDDFVDIISPYLEKLPRRGLVHSFVGTRAQMEKLVDLGFDVSVNGFSFQDRESLDMVAAIPLEKLQIETDAPWGEIKATSDIAKRYLVNAAPAPLSKKKDKWDPKYMVKERNESNSMEKVALIVAGLKGISVEQVANTAWQNSVDMFNL